MKTNTARHRASVDSGSHRANTVCFDDGRSSVVSSASAEIFYSNAFSGHSAADLWHDATKASNKGSPGERDDVRSDCGILKNRTPRVLTMDLLNERAARFQERCTTDPVKKRRYVSSPYAISGTNRECGDTAARSADKKPFQRFRPTCTDTRSDAPLATSNSALRTYMTRHMGSINEGNSNEEHKPRCRDSGKNGLTSRLVAGRAVSRAYSG